MTGWVEAIAVTDLNSKQVADFWFRDIFVRFGVPQEIVEDGGSENKGLSDDLKARFLIQGIKISPYNSQANGFLKRAYQDLLRAIAKETGGNASK